MEFSRRTPQGGFTLIELVVVIVILGILAAFAIPRFVNISTQAREAAVRGLAGSLRSSVALAHGLALAQGNPANIQMEGQTVALAFGYPTPAGVLLTVANLDGFTVVSTATTVTFTPTNAPTTPANCQVTYTAAVDANTPATVALPATMNCA